MRKASDFLQRGAPRVVENELREKIETFHLEFIHHFDEAAGARVIAGAKRVDVAFQLDRQAGAGPDEVELRYASLGEVAYMREKSELAKAAIRAAEFFARASSRKYRALARKASSRGYCRISVESRTIGGRKATNKSPMKPAREPAAWLNHL